MRVMTRKVGVDERPGHYQREVIGGADRLENRLAVARQIRSLVPNYGLAHGRNSATAVRGLALAGEAGMELAKVLGRHQQRLGERLHLDGTGVIG